MIRLALLSGLLSDEAAWAPVAALLADDAEITTVGFKGFDAITAMAEHALSVLPPRFALAGHSMGGRVALEVLRLAPERVLGMALLNVGIHPPGPHEPQRRGQLLELARQEGMTALAQAWLPPMMGKNAARIAAVTPALTAMVERYDPESFAAQQHALVTRPDGAPSLRATQVPILLITGADDGWSPPAQHEAIKALKPEAELVIVPDAGHFMPVEQPEATAQALRRWLHSLDAA